MSFKIYLSPPSMGGKEAEYVKEAFDTNWIAPYGPSLIAFEKDVARYVDVDSSLAVVSGTAAIHLTLRWFGVGVGDTVFCSDFTFAGSCNPILYQGAEPVFIDSEPESWNMSPAALERAFEWAKKNNRMPKAVIVVDLYGEPADWDSIMPICRRYGVPVIEDAAEALGASYKGRRCGSFGELSTLSFNGNKIVTTSGGGMVLSDSNAVAIEKMRFWSTQSREPTLWYEHKEYGYNYRMSNVSAAIGRGQMEYIDYKLKRRAEIKAAYMQELDGAPAHIKQPSPKAMPNNWLSMLVMDTDSVTPTEVVTRLQNADIESRPAWKPMHMQPVFKTAQSFAHSYKGQTGEYVSEAVFSKALCLPSGDALTEEQQQYIIDELKRCIKA